MAIPLPAIIPRTPLQGTVRLLATSLHEQIIAEETQQYIPEKAPPSPHRLSSDTASTIQMLHTHLCPFARS